MEFLNWSFSVICFIRAWKAGSCIIFCVFHGIFELVVFGDLFHSCLEGWVLHHLLCFPHHFGILCVSFQGGRWLCSGRSNQNSVSTGHFQMRLLQEIVENDLCVSFQGGRWLCSGRRNNHL